MTDLLEKFKGFYDSENNPDFAEITAVSIEGNDQDKELVGEWALQQGDKIKTMYVEENQTFSPPFHFIQKLQVDGDTVPFLSGLITAIRLVESGANTPNLVHDDSLIKDGVIVNGITVSSLEEIEISTRIDSDWRVIGWETTRKGDNIVDTIIWRDKLSLRRVLTYSKWDHYPDEP